MKKAKIISIYILVCVLLFFGGWFAHSYYVNPEIRIVEKTKIETRYIKADVKDYSGLLVCYKSSIEIDGTIESNHLTVIASDACKESRRGFKLKTQPHNPKHCIMAQYSGAYINTAYHSFYGISYYHRFGFLGVGGGPIVSRNEKDKSMGGGLQIGLQIIF